MSLFSKSKDESKKQAMELLNSGVANVEEKNKLYSSLFPYCKISDATNDFQAFATVATNEIVALAVSTTLDQVSEHSIVLDKLERFITLHVPKIEDGGNFGVGVQLDLVKKISEMKESTNKSLEALMAYYSARADAIGKLSLPSVTKTTTQSNSGTITDGKKEEKSSETTDEKSSETIGEGPAFESKVAAVVAVDYLYYSKARGIMGEIILSFVAVMDFIDKNKDKLVEPKGKSGSSNFSMY